jgi:hypothetical protein
MPTNTSLAGIPEHDLVDLIAQPENWRLHIPPIKGISQACVPARRISMAGLPNSPPGDVDLLLADPAHPEEATAIEVKRIKVVDGNPNKLQELSKGVRQANRLEGVGFYQVYLCVIVVADSRGINRGRRTYNDGISIELRSKISQLLSALKLRPRVGLMHFRFSQPMESEPFTEGSFDCFVRPSTRGVQSPEVTDWVRKQLAQRGCG